QQVARTPHATAILHVDRQLDYQTLNDHADRLARRIIDTGLHRSGIIAILINRSIESVTAMLAVLKAGAAYLPLDPDHPSERLESTVRDCGARLLLYHETKVNIGGVSSLDIGKGSEPSTALPPRNSKGHDPAYVIHTSGSTGAPKGVRIPHRGVLRLVLNTNYINIREDDRIAHASNPAFDASTFEIWGALLNGACLTIVDREELLSPQLLRRRLLTDRISVMFLTTSLFNLAAELAPESFDSLRVLLFGGEAADPEKVRRVCERDHDVEILNVYGPTESTSFATFYRIETDKVSNLLPIGRAISNTSLHVLDPHGKRVPPGIAGELFIGGDGLAIDYWQSPELTAERFPTLHLEGGNQRLYRSGDRVRWNREGELEFLGRLDRQIKMRGFRIEPGEIEATLTSHPDVSAAVVIVVNDGAAGPRLVAYVVTVSKIEKLSTFLAARLPGYMVPATIIPLAELPLTPNGKLDRKRLPSPQRRPVSPDNERLSDQQQKLAEIWRDLLGLDQVSLDDDFFSLGGHSLLSLRLIHRIEAEFDKSIPLTALFKQPTIRGLSERLNESSSDLLALQFAGKLTPVFFLYADYLNGRGFSQALAERLGSDRPLHVLPPLSSRVQRLSSGIEEEASNQVTKLKEATPRGPWILAGYCAGAWVAYEMARQLEQAGESVESLILVELPSPDQPTLNLVGDGIVKAGGLFGLDPGRQLALFSLLWSLRWKARGFSKLLRSPGEWSSIPTRCWRWIEESLLYAGRAKSGWNGEKESADPIRDGSLELLWQRARYRAGNYSGPVHLLLAESATPEAAKRALASWQRLAPATSLTLIPGDHESCVQEHRSDFADRFTKLLDS
ncbi:amino acid adenylation domain-containing protein, partial [Haloferula sp.]|uniref:amino acid adenylation domain-containing protein n=1 Tax=Haloferula sp. TaxID=2497595 RepID=UPI003C7216E2